MILQYLATDKVAICACSQAAHEFRHIALSFVGHHLTVDTVDRLKECPQMISAGSFQHIRSLDLDVKLDKTVIREEEHLAILGAFAQYRVLNSLWLSEVPFDFLQQHRKEAIRETATALGSTVTELGLYECHFSSYEEMISFVRSFPFCNLLFIRDCVTGKRGGGRNAFAGLPEHVLTIKDLQLSSPTPNDPMIDLSNLIKDAALDVGSLTALVCNVGTSERTQRVAASVFASPVEQFQVACAEPGGFQGMHTPLNPERGCF